jgi:3-oxoadipate enol-lactonase
VDDDRVIEAGETRLAYRVWGSPGAEPPDPAWLGRLGRITAETLVIAGGAPSYIPQEWVVELARRIPDSQLETIPVGHLIHSADPEAFARTALRFLNSA